MKRGVLFILVGGFFYICLVLLWCRQYNILTVKANELTEEITEDYGYLSSFEEDSESDDSLLQDTITPIKDLSNDFESSEDITEDYKDIKNGDSVLSDSFEDEENPKKLLGGTRSVIVNTYDPTVDWLFDQNFFYYLYNNSYLTYVFPDNYFGDRQDELINVFFNHLLTEKTYYKWHYENPSNGFSATLISVLPSNNVNSNTYYNIDGYPSKNTYWEIPEPIPDPTPTPTPEPEITPTPTPGGEVVIDEKFKIMIIFCFGLSAGVIVGHFLTGFLK